MEKTNRYYINNSELQVVVAGYVKRVFGVDVPPEEITFGCPSHSQGAAYFAIKEELQTVDGSPTPVSGEYVYTDTEASAEEEQSMRDAFSGPCIQVGNSKPINPAQVVHDVALKHGLPEIRGHYGYDFGKRRFVHLAGAEAQKPDSWG